MKRISLFMVVLLFVSSVAYAAEVSINIGGDGIKDEAYPGAKGVGIGIVKGETNGLSIKSWVSHDHAFQFDANWDLYYGGFGIGAAYLIHNFDIIEADNNKFPLYFGIKGWINFAPGTVAAGIQVPLGMAWIPRSAPIDIFIQVEPGISIVPSVRFAPGGGIGIRFWLS